MKDRTTNLALLMNVTHVTPNDLHQGLGADLSLISRWRTGARPLAKGTPW